MSLIERGSRLLLGERMALPPELPPGCLPPGVVLRRGRLVPWLGGVLARMRAPAAAVALRRTIVVSPDVRLTRSLLEHELTHVRQWREDALFPAKYALATLRHGYHANPYEVEARAASAARSPSTPTESPS
jgi:hypothetical protein